MRGQVAGLAVVLACIAVGARAQGGIEAELGQETALGEPLREREALVRFYAERGGEPAWLEHDWLGRQRVRSTAAELLAALRRSERHGLRSDAYHAREIAHALETTGEPLAELDVLLSDAFLHYARQLATGAVDPRQIHPGFERSGGAAADPAHVLADALASGRIPDSLESLAPPPPEYAALVRELERLRADPAAAARADQVRANLERWRWLPRDLGRRHVRVNAATFSLAAFDAGVSRLALRVVVGEPDWKTPLARGSITHLVLNPAWRVPHSIATREMLPAAQRNPGYFREKGIQVWAQDGNGGQLHAIDPRRVAWRGLDVDSFRYQLRQRPGPHNPLGQIKFSFANPYGVYLHGTPGDLAFTRALRALSHGCVRVEDEIALAEFALAPDPTWTRERLLETLRTAWEHRLALPEPLPVYLLYFTATPGTGGTISYSADSYGWDRELLRALSGQDQHRGADRAALGEEIHVGIGEPDAAVGPIEMARVAAPARAFAVEPEPSAELRVARGRRPARVRSEDPLIGGVGEARFGARDLGVGDRRIIDRNEEVEAARLRWTADPVLAFGGARVPDSSLGTHRLAPERSRHLHDGPSLAVGSYEAFGLDHLDAVDAHAGNR